MHTFPPVNLVYVSPSCRSQEWERNFTPFTVGLKIMGLLMKCEVRKSWKEVPLYVYLSLRLKVQVLLPQPSPRTPSCIPPPASLHLEPVYTFGLDTKCGISMPWALHLKCQAPKYPLKCSPVNCPHQCLHQVPAGTLAACMTFQRSVF